MGEAAWLDDQICRMEAALGALVAELAELNPELLAITRVAWERRIAKLRLERERLEREQRRG